MQFSNMSHKAQLTNFEEFQRASRRRLACRVGGLPERSAVLDYRASKNTPWDEPARPRTIDSFESPYS